MILENAVETTDFADFTDAYGIARERAFTRWVSAKEAPALYENRLLSVPSASSAVSQWPDSGSSVSFEYALDWIQRDDAFAIDPTSLPLQRGPHHQGRRIKMGRGPFVPIFRMNSRRHMKIKVHAPS